MAGFNHVRTITKASTQGLDTIKDYYNKGICSHGSLVNKSLRWDSLDASITLKGQVVFVFSNVYKYYLIFFNQHRNINDLY